MQKFKCADSERVIQLDLDILRRMLSKEDAIHFSQLLATYLSNTSYEVGAPAGNAICGLMQGLVAHHPNTQLTELKLDKEHSRRFIRLAEYEAVEQALKAGYSVPLAFANRGIIRGLVSEFFVANGFLKLAD